MPIGQCIKAIEKCLNSSLKSRPYCDREKRWNNYLNGTSSVAFILESKSEKTLGQFFSIRYRLGNTKRWKYEHTTTPGIL